MEPFPNKKALSPGSLLGTHGLYRGSHCSLACEGRCQQGFHNRSQSSPNSSDLQLRLPQVLIALCSVVQKWRWGQPGVVFCLCPFSFQTIPLKRAATDTQEQGPSVAQRGQQRSPDFLRTGQLSCLSLRLELSGVCLT